MTDGKDEGANVIKVAFDNAEPDKPNLREVVAALAEMDSLDYLEVKKAKAKELGIPVADLDRVVKEARAKDGGNDLQGEMFTIDPPDPWPDPVDGDVLADELLGLINRYVWLPYGGAEITVLWILHTHVFGAWRISPRLLINSPEKGCGKSTLLNCVLGRAVYKPLMVSNLSPAVLFRAIAKFRPCMLIDEVDAFMKRDEELRGVVNSAHTVDGSVLRVEGDGHDIRKFSTWAPMAFAGIGRLPDTIEDRSIIITMSRRTDAEPVEDIDGPALEAFEAVARKASRWGEGLEISLANYRPEMPPGMMNRVADNWRPLLAVADAVGGHWPQTIRTIAGAHIGAYEETSARVLVLVDIWEIFDECKADRLSTTYLVEKLGAMDDRPWSEWKNGKPITNAALNRLLKHFEIKPRAVRFGREGNNVAKGYLLSQFADAFKRYVMPVIAAKTGHLPPETVTSLQSNKNNNLGRLKTVTNAGPQDFVTRDRKPYWQNSRAPKPCREVRRERG